LTTAVLFYLLVPSLLTAAQVDDAVDKAFEPLVYQSPGSNDSLPYRLLKPKSVEPGMKYPLVLFLHGAGERGDDNKIQLVHGADQFARDDRREQYPAFVVFPQCPTGQRWVESDWGLQTGRGEFDDEPSDPMRLTLELVDQLAKDLPIDTDRLYVTGLSMGGMGTWFAAQAEPKRFAAMLEICGGGDPTWADRYAGIPIWIFHGQADGAVPIARNREMVAALTAVGHHPELRYIEYPGVNHNSWTQTYKRDDVFEWLFAQHK
jgi:predicted peptidase